MNRGDRRIRAGVEAERFFRDLLGQPQPGARPRVAPPLSPAAGDDPRAPYRVFDSVASGTTADELAFSGLAGEHWQIIGRPHSATAAHDVREGDLVIRRALGEGRLATVLRVGESVGTPELYGVDGRLRCDTLVLRALDPRARVAAETAAVESFPASGIDAAIMWNNGKAYFFKGDSYVRFSVAEDWADEGYPKKIKNGWEGVWERNIDAVVMWNNSKAYFFKGDEYIRFPVGGNRADEGYPAKIKGNWKGLWERGIDAALTWNDGKAYFFKGDEYIAFPVGGEQAEPGYPKKIKDDWPGLWERGIQAAVMWPNGKAYFFKGSEYIRVSANRRADPGYPRPIKGNWVARPWTWMPKSRRPAANRAVRGNFPARPSGAPTGSAFIATIQGEQPPAVWQTREKAIWKELVRGNVPDSLTRRLVRVDLSVTRGTRTITGSVQVMPDYLCIGDDKDEDYVYIPMDPVTAQRVAFELDMNLPTARICHAVWGAAGKLATKNQLEAIFRDYSDTGPTRKTPRNRAQTATAAYAEHSDAIKKQMKDLGLHLGDFVAGHKKDVVLSQGLHANPLRIAFHGFYKDGVPTEPCREPGQTLPGCKEQPAHGHGKEKARRFCDSAQGVRLVSDDMTVDGAPMSMRKVLTDPVLSYLLSADGPIDPPQIPEPPDDMLAQAYWETE